MVLLIDNYDSFVFNLSRYIIELGNTAKVVRNDAVSINDIINLNPTCIVLSPGPCTPNEAGICVPLVKHFSGKIPILGICLGHQAIAQAFGGKVVHASYPMHGKSSLIKHDDSVLFTKIQNPLKVARYHSLSVSKDGLPEILRVTATSHDGEIMALEHKKHPVFGLQFHPESILTEQGHDLLRNFLELRHC